MRPIKTIYMASIEKNSVTFLKKGHEQNKT